MVAGEDVTLRLGALFQPRVSYARDGGFEGVEDDTELLGFGIRRMRLSTRATVGDRLEGAVQLEAATPSVRVLDARIGYRVADGLTLSAGRFISAQPRAFALTLAGTIDAVDRAVIADTWARNTIGADGRSHGLEARYRAGGSDLRLFIHNGSGALNVRSGMADTSPAGGTDRTGMAAGLFITHRPAVIDGLEVGGYAGYNASRNPETEVGGTGRRYTDVSLHAYLGALPGSRPVRLKADFIGVFYESVQIGGVDRRDEFMGGALFAAVSPARGTEVFTRGEIMRPPGQAETEYVLTAGGTLSVSALRGRPFASERLTIAYAVRSSELDGRAARHIIILQAQLSI